MGDDELAGQDYDENGPPEEDGPGEETIVELGSKRHWIPIHQPEEPPGTPYDAGGVVTRGPVPVESAGSTPIHRRPRQVNLHGNVECNYCLCIVADRWQYSTHVERMHGQGSWLTQLVDLREQFAYLEARLADAGVELADLEDEKPKTPKKRRFWQ